LSPELGGGDEIGFRWKRGNLRGFEKLDFKVIRKDELTGKTSLIDYMSAVLFCAFYGGYGG
jgi:hypothetical protein